MQRVKYRTVWISDTHLGSRGAQAAQLSHFLKRINCDTLYFVGDIIDFWRLKSKVYWPWQHNAVLRRTLQLAKRGAKIIYIPGNHDEALRQYVGLEFGGILIRREAVHETADGRKLLVTHGDEFDLVVTRQRLLSFVGAAAYDRLIVINRFYNRWRRWRGRPYRSLSQYLKLKVKSACMYVSRFEESLTREARTREFDGVVCGHIHKPEIDEAADVRYYNCGDWIENCTALVEYGNGEMELINAHEFLRDFEEDDTAADQAMEALYPTPDPPPAPVA
ncbi:MAG: UDP-2,3-diacylglucosamine diphosphatase [Planctomycetota bacterium]|nr:UDP-2,3-diacylglucosamine diphosphatase [Planctomycetota bacterium]